MRMSKSLIAEKVREYIEPRCPAGVALTVHEPGIYRVHGYWHVPLQPYAEPKNLIAYYEAIADLEIEIQEKEKLNVIFSTL